MCRGPAQFVTMALTAQGSCSSVCEAARQLRRRVHGSSQPSRPVGRRLACLHRTILLVVMFMFSPSDQGGPEADGTASCCACRRHQLLACRHSIEQEVSPGPNSRSTWDSSLDTVVASCWASCGCSRRNSGILSASVACEVPAVPIDAVMPPPAPVVLHGAVLAIAPSDHSRCRRFDASAACVAHCLEEMCCKDR